MLSYFNNEFFDLVEFVSRNQLPAFGVPPDVVAIIGSGAYVNSQSFKAQGIELSGDARFGELRLAGSYTYLDAEVTESLSSSVSPLFNPLVSGRADRRLHARWLASGRSGGPAHTGNLLVSYVRGRAAGAVSAYFAGKADDSTFLVFADENFGNSLLLPNRDLNFGYAKVDLSGSVRILPRVKWFATLENLFGVDYQPVFGFPALPLNIRTGIVFQFGG